MQAQSILVDVTQYIPAERAQPRPSIKVLVSAVHSDADIDATIDQFKFAFGSARFKTLLALLNASRVTAR